LLRKIFLSGNWIPVATKICLLFIIVWAGIMMLFPVKPFWVDEWRLLSNLKFKDVAALRGHLDFTQQFPRVYLIIIKKFTEWLNYSYFSLRFPAFVVSVANILLVYSLMKKLYPAKNINSFLFIMILVSSQTFTDYLVQIKHYEMEIFLCLVAIWQCLQIQSLIAQGRLKAPVYILLCLSFLLAPFFSYTYPIAVAPVFLIAFYMIVRLWASPDSLSEKLKALTLYCFPLLLGIISIYCFYLIDVKQLMADDSMHKYWQYRMAGGGFLPLIICEKIFRIFSEVGSGFIFELIFGIVGLSAFIYSTAAILKEKRSFYLHSSVVIRLYAILLLVLVWALFIFKKIPIGEPKFNAFTVPAIAILIVYFLDQLLLRLKWANFSRITASVLLLALFGNILSTAINTFTAPEYAKRMRTYNSTEENIKIAIEKNIPLVITSQVAYPDQIWIITPNLMSITGDWVLKTFPAYKVKDNMKVYAVDNLSDAHKITDILPPGTTSYMVGDGINYTIFKR